MKVHQLLAKQTNKKLYCDNMAVVEVIRSGKTRDSFLAICARNIWLITAYYFNIKLHVIHVPGKANDIADFLSRWLITTNPEGKLGQLLPNFSRFTHINLTALN